MNQGNIDQIRDIIFGQQMSEYSEQFKGFEKQLADLQKSMDKMGKELENTLKNFNEEAMTAISSLREDRDKQHESLEKKLKSLESDIHNQLSQLDNAQTPRNDLGSYLIELGQKLQGDAVDVSHTNGAEKE